MTEITLNAFKGNLKEISRPNRFLLSFLDTNLVSNIENIQGYQYYIRTASIPTRTIGDVSNLYWQGMNYKIAGDPIYDDYTVMFLNDVDFKVRSALEEWLEIIRGSVDNLMEFHENYKGSIKLEQLNGLGKIVGTYYLYGVYPKAIDAIELSQEASDTLEEFSVTFSIEYWSDSPSISDGKGVVDNIERART